MKTTDEILAMLEKSSAQFRATLASILPARPKAKRDDGGSLAAHFTALDKPGQPEQKSGSILDLRAFEPKVRQPQKFDIRGWLK